MARSRFVISSLLAFGAMLVSAAPAAAGAYTVYSCKTPTGKVAPTDGWQLFDNSAASGTSGNDCELGGSLHAAVRSTAADYAGMKYGWTLTPPPNTSIASADVWKWGTTDRWSDGQPYGAAAWLSFGDTDYSKNVWSCNSQKRCFQDGYLEDTVNAANKSTIYVTPGANRLMALMVGCVGSGQCPQGANSTHLAEVSMQAAELTMFDNQAPVIPATPEGALLGAGDHRGTEALSFRATDLGAGLYRVMLDVRGSGSEWATSRSIVDGNGGHCAEFEESPQNDHEFGYLVPCKLSADVSVSLDTQTYHDGTYELRVRIEDAAGNTTVVVPSRPLVIHNAPVVEPDTVAVTGVARLGSELTANAGTWAGDNQYTYAWLRCTSAEPETCAVLPGATKLTYTPVMADLGRWLRFQVIASNPEGTVTENSSATGPIANAAGIVPQCADGTDNDDDSLIDELDPQCKDRADNLEAPDPPLVTPTPVPTATATPGGSTASPSSPSPTPTPVRTPTPTATAGSAGGSGSGSGSPAAINPSGAAHPTVSISGGGRRTLGLGRRATALVSLVDAHGRPISSARLTVLERLNLSGAGFRSAGLELTTDAGGAAQLPISPGPSRTLRVTYREGGGDGAPDATADVLVLVRSKTTLRKSRSFLRNGDTLRFSGRLLSMPVPASGVGIDLQAQVGHRWQTFKTLKTNGEGRWRSHYRFRSTRGLQTYRFRARVRGDSAFPYLPSTSKQISVRVQG